MNTRAAVTRNRTRRRPSRFAASLATLALLTPAALQAQSSPDIKPTPQQVMWQDLEFGVILHFGTNTFLDREWGDGTADPKIFNPTNFNPDQWMDAIAASGAKYVVFVAKHHDGFVLWPTGQTDYSIKASPWKNGKGDMVREVAEAARRHGLKFGVYLSPWDRHDPRYKDSAAYDTYYNAELEELASQYGELVEFWLDGAGSGGHVYNFPKIIETLRTYQPNSIVFADAGLFEYGDARWAGDETGKIDYENWNVLDRHGYLRWRPVEVDTPLRKLHWFWHPNDDASLKSVPELLDSYENSVGRGGQWMLGVAPNNKGLLDTSDVARLRELGAAIHQRYGTNLALDHAGAGDNAERALDGDHATFWTSPTPGSGTLEVKLPKAVTLDHTLTMEWLNEGQAVQRYRIEVLQNKAWKTVVDGYALGHKKIDHFAPVTTDGVRLVILSAAGTARIREFQLFSIPDISTTSTLPPSP